MFLYCVSVYMPYFWLPGQQAMVLDNGGGLLCRLSSTNMLSSRQCRVVHRVHNCVGLGHCGLHLLNTAYIAYYRL